MVKTICFEIVYGKNQQIHQNGYVEIPDDENEEVEWVYFDQQGFEQSNQFTHHDGVGLTMTDEQYAEIELLIEDFKANIKEYHYNFLGLVFSYLKVPRHLNNRFTCTQFVAWVLTTCNVKIIDKPTSLIYPNDYYKMPKSRIIYSGKLHKYNLSAAA